MTSMRQQVISPMAGIVVEIPVSSGDVVREGQEIVILEAMKLETVIRSEGAGLVRTIHIEEGQIVENGQLLFSLDLLGDIDENTGDSALAADGGVRTDLLELEERRYFLKDENRPEAVARRKRKGKLTARENIELLCESGSFIEYGSLTIAAQRSRRTVEDLQQHTPADGIITGIGRVNGSLFPEKKTECMILAYDYTVLAGTQGFMGHKKTDRMLQLAGKMTLPIVFFTEGGGGRPGDTDFQGVGGLDVSTFYLFSKLSGEVPRIAIVGGYCFAGNAALSGSADVIIATQDSAIGMGGPAMIEGGGLGVFHPTQVGPSSVQSVNGVIDILVKDEKEAIAKAKQYLSYFQGTLHDWKASDQQALRDLVPQNRRRTYDMYALIRHLADEDSFLELRKDFGEALITGLVRVEGRPLGLLANDPNHMGGAIDSDAADKASRFMQLCEAFSLPILSLCDTPGIMVGPDAEKSGTVRHANRMFLVGAQLTVPIFMIVTRRAYGLGSMAMAGGSFHVPFFTVSWPTGEFGGMGLEGAVKLGFRKELEEIKDEDGRKQLYEQLLAQAYEKGKAINTASYLEIDEVIDPAESRTWIIKGMGGAVDRSADKKDGRRFIDAW